MIKMCLSVYMDECKMISTNFHCINILYHSHTITMTENKNKENIYVEK